MSESSNSAENSAAAEAPAVETSVSESAALAGRVVETLGRHVLGQQEACEALVATYMAGGHALLEGVPGIGKTLLARCFAAVLGREFQRVQATPDLMPADVIGANVYRQEAGELQFHLVRGPVFTEILMIDEINRTPPKTQSALLEAMQEHQATIDGERHALDDELFVVATQNPVEFEGTYPLPEAQLDRFQTRIEIGLPSQEAEIDLYRMAVREEGWGFQTLPEPLLTPDEARAMRRASRTVHASDEVLVYLGELAKAVRSSPDLELTVSPRGALALLETARAAALLEERDFVTPDDVKRFLAPCWGHRILLTPEAELEGRSVAQLLEKTAATVEVPK